MSKFKGKGDSDVGELLQEYYVSPPGQWENDQGPKGWWAIVSEDAGGIIAYACTEELAVLIYKGLEGQHA